LAPTSLLLSGAGSGCVNTGSFTASETGYTGAFTATSANTTLATVALTTPGTSPTFTVTYVMAQSGFTAPPGTTISVTDTLGHSATETINTAFCLP